MANQITLTPDDYQIYYDNQIIGILYNVASLMQPTAHSCWIVSTAALFSFAHALDHITTYKTNSNNHTHFQYVSSLINALFSSLQQEYNRDYNLVDKFREKSANTHNIDPFPYDFNVYKNSFNPNGNFIDFFNEKELFEIIKSLIADGSYGRFQILQDQMNALVEDSCNEENERRDDFILSDYPEIKDFLKNNNLLNGYNDNSNLYISNSQVQHVNKQYVEDFIKKHFINCDSCPLNTAEFKDFFENLCGLVMEPPMPELTILYSKKQLSYYFLKLLCLYGPLIIAYDLDRRTDQEGKASFHFVVLCGIQFIKGKSAKYIVMDSWETWTPDNTITNHPYKELEEEEFFENFFCLTSDFSHIFEQGETLPSQIFHLPEKTFKFSEHNEILIHIA